MSRNVLFLIIGGLIVAVAALGYVSYQDHKEPDGLHINIGKSGVEVKDK